ncbi:MAG: hypothetical protein SF123_18875 [Chloroflexota bacterium]|nr:hypothetical protein [Chloroflexota bacterium]
MLNRLPSFQLWHALKHKPNGDPVAIRMAILRTQPQPPNAFRDIMKTLAVLGAGGCLIPPTLFFFLFALLSYQHWLFLFAGTALAIDLTLGIAPQIAEERRRGVFGLLEVAPGGRLASAWSLCLGWLHYKAGLTRRFGIHRFVMFALAMIGLGYLPFSLVGFEVPISVSPLVWGLIIIVEMLIILSIDFRHSLIAALLCSILGGLLTTRRSEAGVAAMIIFLLVQILVYAAWGLILLITTGATESLRAPIAGLDIAIALMLMLAFAVLREAGTWALWRIVCSRTETQPDIDAALEQSL